MRRAPKSANLGLIIDTFAIKAEDDEKDYCVATPNIQLATQWEGAVMNILKLAIATGVVVGLACVDAPSAKSDEVVRVTGFGSTWAGYAKKIWIEPFEKESAIRVIYDTWDLAREAGLRLYLLAPFLVQRVCTVEPLLRLRGYGLPCPS